MSVKHWRLSVYVLAFAFLWFTVEFVRADPERRMLVLWLLLAGGLAAVTFGLYCSTRAREQKRDEADVVSTVDRIRPFRSAD